jgi:hypothetical protein
MASKLLGVGAALVLGAVSSAANAVSVFLQPSTQTVNVGDTFDVELMWDFTGNAAIGGGTDVMWDASAFDWVSTVFVDNFGTGAGEFDPQLTRCDGSGDEGFCESPGLIDGLATGNFNGLGDPGPIMIATITFTALAEGTFSIDLAEDVGGIGGIFVSAVDFQPYDDLTFTGATVTVESGGAVPVPAAAWLMLSGMGALLGYRRKS